MVRPYTNRGGEAFFHRSGGGKAFFPLPNVAFLRENHVINANSLSFESRRTLEKVRLLGQVRFN